MRNIHKSIDHHEIQKRFSEEEHYLCSFGGKSFKFEDFIPYISKLPQREIDLIEMYFHKEKKQKEIADFFGVTQGAISHRIKRAKKRLIFLRDMPKISEDIKEVLLDYFTEFEIDLIISMVETTCQSKTAEILNKRYQLKDKDKMTQVKIRHKFYRYLRILESKVRSIFKSLNYSDRIQIDSLILEFRMIEDNKLEKALENLNKKYNLKGKKKITLESLKENYNLFMDKAINLEEKSSALISCFRLINYIQNNLYMLHEVILPHFDRGYNVTYDEIL